MTALSRERLKILVKMMRVSWGAHALSTLPGTPSGPAAFLGFTARSTCLTSCSHHSTVSGVVQEPGDGGSRAEADECCCCDVSKRAEK